MAKKPARHAAKATSVKQDDLNSFLVHMILYVLVNLGLFVYLYSNSKDLTLLVWVIIGWGLGLLAHALSVFGIMKWMHKEF
jgi:hypothetical protein